MERLISDSLKKSRGRAQCSVLGTTHSSGAPIALQRLLQEI